MSGTDEVTLESVATPEVQTKAEKMGWIPPTRFRGDPETFIDAEEFIARGEQILPIVRSQNQKLQAEVEQLRGGYAKTQEALEKANKALEEINERHTVATQKAVEQAHKDLKGKLAAALEAGDHAAVAEITGTMVQLSAAQAEPAAVKRVEEPPASAAAPAIPDDLKEWNKANPWYGTDRRKTALALGIAQELRDSGTTLVGVEFYEKVREGVEEVFGAGTPPASKVEGARGSGAGGGSPGRGGKSYASLPADARAACDADTKNFVGEGKRYKTVAEWQKRYAELYFED